MTATDAYDAAPRPEDRPAVGGTGLALPLNLGLPVAGNVEVAGQAEALGYDRVWAAEAGNNDAFGLLTACAAGTRRIGLATGVVPIQTRTPSLMAQSAATLQDASAGRFTLGIGISSPTVVQRWNGVPYDTRLDRMREYVHVVSELLAWQKVTFSGEFYDVAGYQLLMHVPSPPPPVMLGALGPRMLGLAGEISAGALLNWIGAHAVADAVAQVRAGAAAAGRQDPVRTAVFVRVCVTDDVEAARRWARREVMGYVIVPAYRAAFERHGWKDVTSEAMQLWDAGDRKAAAASLPDAFVDSLCLAGPADDVRRRFEAFRAAGVDEPVAFLFSGQTDPERVFAEIQATARALAPQG